MIKFFKQIYFSPLFFTVGIIVVILYVVGFFFPVFQTLAFIALLFWAGLTIIDFSLLFSQKNGIIAERLTLDKLSNGDNNTVDILLENNFPFVIDYTIIDELPFQFQKRDFKLSGKIKAGEKKAEHYTLIPKERGEYNFGNHNVFTKSPIGFVTKRWIFSSGVTLPVYPGFLQMRKYELMAISNRLHDLGVKKIRKIGNNREFEQIKEYVKGDDYRSINWRATARRSKLMVNQYQDEKAQPVYTIIDMGRAMKMPFNGMTLLNYAINASLVLSNIALIKDDKAGLVTFEKKVRTIVKARKRRTHIKTILEVLYNQKTTFSESNFEHLYVLTKKHITQRSLFVLFTNFETTDSLNRQLPFLLQMAKQHLLITVFFKNKELEEYMLEPADNLVDVYKQTIAEKYLLEKQNMMKKLRNYGIQTIYTTPEELTVNTINKYIEVKARGLF